MIDEKDVEAGKQEETELSEDQLMSEQVNTEQTKDANQEKSAELSDDQLKEVAGGGVGVNATDDDPAKVRVTWNAVTGASYKVFRNSSNSS